MIGIYKIENKINGKIYIGQSIHIEQRWSEHLYQSSHCTLLKYALAKYGQDNFTFEVIEECSQQELNEKEIYWIEFYNSYENGYNLTRGGGGTLYFSVEQIYEDFQKTNNMVQTAKNIKCSLGTVRRVLHEFGIDKIELQENKPVEAIDPLTLQTIQKYSSIQEAADNLHINRNGIRMALNGEHKSAGGYFWKYQNEDKIFIAAPVKTWKTKVQQIDRNTKEILREFDSAADAAEFLGKDRKNGGSQISAVCNGRKKTAYGYIWKKA